MLNGLEFLLIFLSTFGIGFGLGKLTHSNKYKKTDVNYVYNRRPYIILITVSAILFFIVKMY